MNGETHSTGRHRGARHAEARQPLEARRTSSALGGFIEQMPGVPGLRMLFDEEGQLKGLPFNAVATAIVMEAVLAEAQRRGCGLRYHPRIVGNALVLEPGEKM